MKKMLALAIAFSGLMAGAVAAQDHSVSMFIGDLDVPTSGGLEMGGTAIEVNAKGKLDGGLRYDVAALEARVDAGKSREFDAHVAYITEWGVGPAASWHWKGGDVAKSDVLTLGLAGEYTLGSTSLYGSVTTDTDNFGDTYLLRTGGVYETPWNLALQGEYQKSYFGGHFGKSVEIGARYNVKSDMFVETKFNRDFDVNKSALDRDRMSVGVGFNF